MALALNTLGFFADAFGLASLLSDQFSPDVVEGTNVAIKLAFDSSDGAPTGFDGEIESVYAFDYSNTYLGTGSAPAGTQKGGEVVKITVDQEIPDRQGRYVGVAVGDDDVCILLVTAGQHDGSYQGTWNGDIGFNCGQAWYMQGEVAGTIGPNNDNWVPRCSWFGNSEHGAVSNAFKFNTIAYGTSSNQTLADESGCPATIYSNGGGVISDQPGGADTVSKKRSANSLALPAVRASWMEQLLVVSSHDHQTAEELCTHGMSYGPDFVDSKGNYCDMSTKTLSPLCTGTETTGCVTFSEDGKTISKRSSVARRTVDAVHKSFTNVKNIGPK